MDSWLRDCLRDQLPELTYLKEKDPEKLLDSMVQAVGILALLTDGVTVCGMNLKTTYTPAEQYEDDEE